MSSKLTQTELGEEFGLSSIAMGKKLIELKLRDAETKLVTKYAFDNKLGKNVTYTKDGKEINMAVWNEKTVQYIKNKSLKDYPFCAQILISKLKVLKKIDEEDTGMKIDQMKFDWVREEFLKVWKSYSENIEVLTIFVEKLEKENLIDFAEQFEEMKNLQIIVRKNNLENQLKIKNIKEKKTKI